MYACQMSFPDQGQSYLCSEFLTSLQGNQKSFLMSPLWGKCEFPSDVHRQLVGGVMFFSLDDMDTYGPTFAEPQVQEEITWRAIGRIYGIRVDYFHNGFVSRNTTRSMIRRVLWRTLSEIADTYRLESQRLSDDIIS